MSLVSSAPLFTARNSRSGYQIEQSLRFNDDDSAYLQLNGGTSPTDGKIFTISVWVKRSELGDDNNIFGSSPAASLYNDLRFGGDDKLCYRQVHSSGGASAWNLTASAVSRDTSAWYHVVLAVDTTQSTSSDRVKMYVNGTQITSFSTAVYPGQNQVPLGAGGSYAIGIGRLTTTYTQYFDGYMAEYHYVDGTAHTPTDFGEYDTSGVWRPIEVSGITYGARGFYMKFDETAANGIGHDHSGNSNHFTPNNFTTSGTGTDVMSDTPTTNYCTINPLAYAFVYYGPNAPQNGNLEVVPRQTYSGNWTHGVGTFPLTSGKWYFEIENDGGTNAYCGLYQVSDNTSWPWNQETSSYQYVYQSSNGYKRSSSGSPYGASWQSAGDIVGVAYDGDNGTLTFYKNGTSQGTAFTGLTGTYVPRAQVEDNSGAKLICNFGQRDFAYTPPTGFKALNTSNLPAPDIADGSDYFNTVLYTGTNSTQSITGVNFQPDFVWIKERPNVVNHNLIDAVRGSRVHLSSNLTNADYTEPSTRGMASFDTDGFTLDQDNAGPGRVNSSGQTYVAWNWLAGNGTSSNTAGSITSTVSANATAGFSIVTYTGTGSNATVGHGLGVAPSMIIIKNRIDTSSWQVYHSALGPTKVILLESTSAAFTSSVRWNDTAPTSTVFTIGTDGGMNGSSDGHVAYCFAEVEGYSKFGSYTGNNSSDGPFVYCGFKPRWIMRKATGDTSNWVILDTARDTYNETDNMLLPNTSGAESDGSDIDILSNGFKMRSAALNGSVAYIFAAFASNPFGGANVSPATAR